VSSDDAIAMAYPWSCCWLGMSGLATVMLICPAEHASRNWEKFSAGRITSEIFPIQTATLDDQSLCWWEVVYSPQWVSDESLSG
jgi:hypothetical protein